jgi:acyl carrier protein
MTTDEVLARLTPVFRDVFDDDAIVLAPGTSARDIDGWDSFANVRLMVSIETELRIRFDVGEFEGFRNVGELAAGIQGRLR